MSAIPEVQESTASTDAPAVEVKSPEFQSFADSGIASATHSLSQIADIKIVVSAELGRANLPIERLLTLGTGSVVELDRSIEGPVEIVAQGIPLACGEVVVVNDCFAIRITSVYPRNRKSDALNIES
jgi:flagellar motor switch protein FliN/FliY